MEKFKVKIGGRWVSEIKSPDVEFCTGEEFAHVFCNIEVNTVREFLSKIYTNNVVEFIPIITDSQPESKPKELDLCEILKDAPRGLKLWSVIYGDVKLSYTLPKSEDYPIFFDRGRTDSRGRHYANFKGGECTLFPSKENRDWSTFKLPYKLPVKGELCWTMSSVGNWTPRFAVGEIGEISGLPLFFAHQNQKFGDRVPYQWQPLSEVPEVLKNHLKIKQDEEN